MLLISFLFGLVYLFTGLGIRLYQCLRAHDYAATFADGICWYLLVGGRCGVFIPCGHVPDDRADSVSASSSVGERGCGCGRRWSIGDSAVLVAARRRGGNGSQRAHMCFTV